MKNLKGKVAVITGAASGIGRSLALRLAGEGARLALSDVQEDGLAETARLARAAGAADEATSISLRRGIKPRGQPNAANLTRKDCCASNLS